MPRKGYDGSENRGSWTARLNRMRENAQSSARSRGFNEGFRSKLELQVAIFLKYFKIPYEFESEVIPWMSEPKAHKYIPDFKIKTRSGKTIYIETKGRFEPEDREKHLCLKKQYPHLDIRLVFSNPHAWDRKALSRSYAKWADKHGFVWCSKSQLKKKLYEWANE
jgi:predicted nuclease of restriction endonuclease-like RecB superfamily